ncbi:MAG: DUF1588 domain-containing protein [Acidimicrobiia bacterium]|nr:DUF1588 domain-containing protein [Acidimicrobiia bacterium]
MNLRLTFLFCLAVSGAAIAQTPYSIEDGTAFLNFWCRACHTGSKPQGNFDLGVLASGQTLATEPQRWNKLISRVENLEMPPKGAPVPTAEQRAQFTEWAAMAVREQACAGGMRPGPSMIRRLNRDEYAATIRDLFDMHLDIAQALPEDGAGGEGFDNAAETLFLTGLHSEKYMAAARFIADFAAREFKSRAKIFTVEPGPQLTEDRAARMIFEKLLPRAFRRPVTGKEISPYVSLYQSARREGESFEGAVLFAVRGALVSPMFLYRAEPPNLTAARKPLEAYALASRLSYFLWGSMPDELLFDGAASGGLQEPAVLKYMVGRMLRNDRSLVFAQRFIEQWLRTRELGGEKTPDPRLFPAYAADEDLRSDIRLQPVLFFREILLRNRSLLELIDSNHTIGTRHLERHYGLQLPLNPNARQQPQWVELPQGSNRGGLLGMAAVLTVSSYPYRTSPVLRGAWIMDSILGTPPPPPPPDVPELPEQHEGAPPQSVRERLARHRADAVCASCHNRMDPLGLPLENFDAIGRWRAEDGGRPVDASAELPDGTRIDGPAGLKAALAARKDLFLRNLTGKMLGYALGRGLTIEDSCTVDHILSRLKDNNYSAQTLIEEIVLSVPFRYQAPGKSLQRENSR